MKAKKHKLRFKPTPISRLNKMTVPFKMVGDPPWNWTASGKDAWASREKAVYAHEMDRKQWPMARKPETWVSAHDHNHFIDDLIRVKWMDYDVAWNEHAERSYPEAERENAAWDYHHEHFIAA